MSDEGLKKSGRRSTVASAKIEGREVPPGHARSDAVQRYLDDMRVSREVSEDSADFGG
ncbi:hypothetical protein [Mycolicibacterium gadium]|uniref:Uncharacterized protein n=1 Tax=Mycolicibacterium gadium TaxID=1794 RepID=A0ABT6GW77_MYCGU|nr:hypothetical protein [Mycolicibacterium gadium]MDG5485487.1 hypothetical protein [Mycolicibacterium gadium]